MKAIESLKDAIDFLEKTGSQASLARAYNSYGWMYWRIGEYNKALHFISKSQKICENKDSPQYNLPKLKNVAAIGIIHALK